MIPKELRAKRVKELFVKIEAMALIAGKDKNKLDQLIAPLCKEIIEITKIQEKLGETPNQIYWSEKKDKKPNPQASER